MREVELVIKIPEEVYIKLSNSNPSYADDFSIYYAIKNGIPIPKGHGAIKDVSQIEIPMCEDRAYERWVQVAINSAPTIIEADEVEE